MAITWSEMNEKYHEAQNSIRMYESKVRPMADLVAGRLQSCNVDLMTLNELKRELQNWNMHTCEWKKK